MSRQVLVYVTPGILSSVLVSGNLTRCTGLPEAARFVRTFLDEDRNAICLVFEHETFAEVQENEELPRVVVTCSVHERRAVWLVYTESGDSGPELGSFVAFTSEALAREHASRLAEQNKLVPYEWGGWWDRREYGLMIDVEKVEVRA